MQCKGSTGWSFQCLRDAGPLAGVSTTEAAPPTPTGVAAAILIAHTPNGHASSECSWYFFAFLADTTLGMALSLGLHMIIMRVASGEAGQGAVDIKETLLGALKVLVPCGDYGECREVVRCSGYVCRL